MNIKKSLLASVAAVMIAASPALAQSNEVLVPGNSGGATWASMPIGSHVMIGGFIFVVTAGGLVLLDDDDNNNNNTPPPPPPPPPSTTTT